MHERKCCCCVFAVRCKVLLGCTLKIVRCHVVWLAWTVYNNVMSQVIHKPVEYSLPELIFT